MKKIYLFITLLLSLATFAQSPEGFNYQATVRNSAGTLITNKSVDFTFKIIKDSPTGTAVYSETRTVTTDDLGAVNLVVGKGIPTTGTFSAVDWGSGNFYLGIELNTGSGNVAMGTTQLLSVPYALYAKISGTTLNQGISTLYITGNISNEEASAQIAAEVGANTQTVIIEETTGLTNIDLSNLKNLVLLRISNNSDLSSINLTGLTKVFDGISIVDNKALSSLSFSSLRSVIRTNPNSYYGGGRIQITNNNALTSISFPQLSSGQLNIDGSSLTSLSLPLLASGGVSVDGAVLTSLSLPNLASGFVNVSGTSLTSLSLPQLVSGNVNVNAPLTSLPLPKLKSGGLEIFGTSLTSLNLPVLTSLLDANGDGLISITKNSYLTSINIPLLTTINATINASNNSLSSSEINKLLNLFNTKVTFEGYGGINLSNQTPLATPTGQGIIDKQSLIDKGINVITN